MRRPSGSTAHRAIKCPASMALPTVEEDEEDEPEYRIRGSAIHAFLQDVAETRAAGFTLDEAIESCLVRVDEKWRPYCSIIDVEATRTDLAPEVALAWNWRTRTAREIGRGIDRAYHLADPPLSDDEIPMTVDLLGVAPGRVLVDDYKSGHSRYPRPGKFGQTLLGGLAAAVLFDADEAELWLTYLDDSGEAWRVHDVIDRWDLEAFAEVVARSMLAGEAAADEVKRGIVPSTTIGTHCHYCPSRRVCPGQTALIRALPDEVTKIEQLALGPENFASTYHAIEKWRKILGEIERQIFANAWRDPIDLGDGRVLGQVETEREYLDGPSAVALMERWYGKEAAVEIAKVTTSASAVKEALSKRKKAKERIETKAGDGLLDRFKRQLREQGSTRVQSGVDIKAHKPRKGSR